MIHARPTQSGLSADRGTERLFFWVLVLLATLMSVKYFPGLEATGAYAGNVFQAIYPDAFPGDPYIGSERPILQKAYQLSLFYLGPKLMGEIWLDDRFILFVYLLLVVVSVVGIDRIVKLCGVTEIAPRLIVQLIFMRDHQHLTLTVTFANQPDLNHAAFAIPATIWLFYTTLARKSLWLIMAMSALTAAFSIKMAPYVIASSLIIAAVNGGVRDRLVIASVFAVALAVFVYAVNYAFPVSDENRVILWNLIKDTVEKWDSNPFHPRPDLAGMLIRNVVFVTILVGALIAPVPRSGVFRDMKIYVGLGLLIWLAAGIYYSLAPDALKIIHLFPFSAVRSLAWPQTVAYLVIMLSLFHWLKDRKNWRNLGAATVIFLFLLVIGPANHGLWAGLLSVSLAAVLAANFLRLRIGGESMDRFAVVDWVADHYAVLLAQALVLTIGIAFASTVWKNLPYWHTWAVHGVYGNSPVAKWIGIAGYLRRNTPADAVVLPFEEEEPGQLTARRHLASRSGRSIAAMMEFSSIFDLEAWRIESEQRETVRKLGNAMVGGDWPAAAADIKKVRPNPDYVLVPIHYVNEEMFKSLSLVEKTRIRDYAILKRTQPKND